MTEKPYPKPNEVDEGNAWSRFKGSVMQAIIHNEMVRQIELVKEKLTTCDKEESEKLQSEVKSHRTLLGFIHSKDKTPEVNKPRTH